MISTAYEYAAHIRRIVDADTLDLDRVDLGFKVYLDLRVRLAGVDAPEKHTPAGAAAVDFATRWFNTHAMTGHIRIRTHKIPQDKYGRYLATVFAPNGLNFNEILVSEGHAAPYLLT